MSTKVEDHEIHLYYTSNQSEFLEGTSKKLAQPTISLKDIFSPADANLPHWLLRKEDATKETLSDQPIWKPTVLSSVSEDFFHPVKALLSGQDKDRVFTSQLASLSPRGRIDFRKLFETSNQSFQATLSAKLSKSAFQRLNSQNVPTTGWLDFQVIDVLLFQFRSGISVLNITLKLSGPTDTSSFAEFVDSIAQLNDCCWRNKKTGEPITSSFSFGEMARTLLDRHPTSSIKEKRVFSSCCIRLPADTSEEKLEECAVRTAKQYSCDYTWSDKEEVQVSLLKPFTYIRRATSPEGAAIVLRNDGSKFANQFIPNKFRTAYSPLALMSLHEQAAWTQLSNATTKWQDLDSPDQNSVENLRQAEYKTVQIQTAYSVARISSVADHDAWKEALDAQLRIPQLRTELAGDLLATSAILSAETDRRQEERFRALTIFGGSLAAGVTSLSALSALFSMAEMENWKWGFNDTISSLLNPPFFISMMGTLAVTTITFLFLSKRYSNKHDQ